VLEPVKLCIFNTTTQSNLFMSSKTILLAFGGASPEHEVSVLTAMQVAAALQEINATIHPLYISKAGQWYTSEKFLDLKSYQDLPQLLRSASRCTIAQDESGRAILVETASKGLFSKPRNYTFDVVIPAFHGSDGENGSFQGLCEQFNVPYTGSGVMGSSVGMDKLTAKSLCRSAGYPVVDDVGFTESDWVGQKETLLSHIDALGYPVFVKPVSLGSSIGVSRAQNRHEAELHIESSFRYDARIMVEKGVTPLMEINCSVLGNPEKAIPSVLEHPVGSGEILSFQDKYQRGETGKGMASAERIIPAPLDDQTTKQIQSAACDIFRTLQCSGVARLDFLMNSETGAFFFNEINTIPGSFSFYLWQHSGIHFPELLDRMIALAIERHVQKNGRVRSYETNLLSQKAARGLKGLKGSKGS
jgi:D-alanine-D-alanine ligase